EALNLGAAWKLVLGIVFVLLVCFLRRGIIGGIADVYGLFTRKQGLTAQAPSANPEPAPHRQSPDAHRIPVVDAPMPLHRPSSSPCSGPLLHASGLTKRYGGLVANSDIQFSVKPGELRGVIGPNGAGKTTFFKMLTCEVRPTSGRIMFDGRDITGMRVT